MSNGGPYGPPPGGYPPGGYPPGGYPPGGYPPGPPGYPPPPGQPPAGQPPPGPQRSEAELAANYPALEDLAAVPKGRIPFIQQLSAMECGAASLAMVLAFYGRRVALDDVREVLGPGRDGVTALGIIHAADFFGLRGRGVRVDLDELELLDRGSILHWRFSHFVVLDRVRRGGVDIVDPAVGRRHVSMEEFSRSFTGVALVFEPGDDFRTEKKREGGMWRFVRHLVGEHKGVLFQVVVASLFIQLVALSVPLLTSLVVDKVLPRGDRDLLLVVSVGLLGVIVFQFASSFLRAHLLLALRTRLDARMMLAFLDHLVSLPYPFFQTRPAGDLMMRLSSNAQVREIVTGGALSGLLDGSLVILYLGILFLGSWIMAVVSLGIGFLYLVLYLSTRRAKRELAAQIISKEARSSGYQIEMLSGMDTLKSLGAEQRAAENWSHLFVDALNASLRRGKLDAAVDSLMGTLRFSSPLVILAIGAWQVLEGNLSLGNMLALSAVAAGFLTPLSTLISTAIQFQTVQSYVERLDDVLRAVPEQDRSQVKPSRKLQGHISLHKVSFRYSPVAPLVLKEVSVEIAPGSMVGVVGRSGSGKSTLISILAGLYQPTSGRVLFDGFSLYDFDLRSVRRQLGVVTQNPYLFGDTIRANITLADPHASYEEMLRAAQLACIHDEIMAMPLAYDTPLLDRGASLSGGQRQRIALARALLAKPAVMILDEATSALDGITERKVQQALANLRCTRVVIAHRLSTVRDADMILVLHDGVLVEQGDHGELLAKGGYYHRLAFPEPGSVDTGADIPLPADMPPQRPIPDAAPVQEQFADENTFTGYRADYYGPGGGTLVGQPGTHTGSVKRLLGRGAPQFGPSQDFGDATDPGGNPFDPNDRRFRRR
ncbi:MAG TPA: peptidase domain-containing ABC transporter [Kofleriaceae bacterium]|nr:peptidase domain-containing ABC transporter [Kofleriaceae bacterium]